jgi:hypothetical protein
MVSCKTYAPKRLSNGICIPVYFRLVQRPTPSASIPINRSMRVYLILQVYLLPDTGLAVQLVPDRQLEGK